MIRFSLIFLILAFAPAFSLIAQVDPIEGSTTGFEGYPYRLYTPETATPDNPLPMVLFLHGSFERGTDNKTQVESHIQPLIESCLGTDYPAFLVAPQSAQFWDPMILRQLTERLIQTLPVDAKRVYLTGISVGGRATWDTASKGLDLFAAGVPLSPRKQMDAAHRMGVSGIPLWAFHGDSDNVVSLRETTDMIDAIEAAGGHPRFTLLAGFAHNGWTPIYADEPGLTDSWTGGAETDETPSLYPWLFAKELPENPYEYPSLMDGESILLDFGGVHAPPGEVTWNNITADPASPGNVITALLTAGAEPRSTGLRIIEGFEGTEGNGVSGGNPYPAEVAADAWRAGSSEGHETALNKPASIILTGLPTDKTFRLRFFSSRQSPGSATSYPTRFTVNGQSVDLEASNNASQRATLYRMVADEKNDLKISVSPHPDSDAPFAYLNALELLVEPWPLTFAYWSELRGIDPQSPNKDQNQNGIPELLDFLFGNETDGPAGRTSFTIAQGMSSVRFPIRTEPTAGGILWLEQSDNLQEPWEELARYDFSTEAASNLERLADESGTWLRAVFPADGGTFFRLRGEIP